MTTQRQKRRAMYRVALGTSQMMAAVVTIMLVLQLGVCKASIAAGSFTTALLITSLVLYRLRD